MGGFTSVPDSDSPSTKGGRNVDEVVRRDIRLGNGSIVRRRSQ
jgi:hypothetical protein